MSSKTTVAAAAAERRLDVFISELLGISRAAAQKLIKNDLVSVNQQTARSSYLVCLGDVVVVADATRLVLERPNIDLPIVYEDDDMVVVNKPAGLITEAGNGRVDEPSVADFARSVTSDETERPGIVHRLDRETSGLLVIAKSAEAKQALRDEWKRRRVKKTYVALLVGRIEPQKASIRLPLDRDPARPTQRRVSTGGKPAVTNYERVLDFTGYSLVVAKPETGRTHQLRVHFAATGHPIAGDVVYGSNRRPLGLKRQFLHASGLELTSPSGQKVSLEIPLPDDLQSILDELQNEL